MSHPTTLPTLGADQSFVATLRDAVAADVAFDQRYPEDVRLASRQFWTPVIVARTAAAVFRRFGVKRVLDVGAGAGKLCLVAAATAPGIQFTGVEQRVHLVRIARELGAELGLENARFLAGDATCMDWTAFDGLFFYNPFMENVFVARDHFDASIELSEARFVSDVRRAEAALDRSPVGTCVITYYRFGGRIPNTYELAHVEQPPGSNWIRVWVKRRGDANGYMLETDNGAFIACKGPLPPDPRPDVLRMLNRADIIIG